MPFSGYQDFNPDFSNALQQMIAERPGLSVYSGYRSPERQAELYQQAIAKYGSPEAARKWVAPPGKSRHNHGIAADLAFASDADKAWAHENAARFGLNFRMGHEPWHIELAGGAPEARQEGMTMPISGSQSMLSSAPPTSPIPPSEVVEPFRPRERPRIDPRIPDLPGPQDIYTLANLIAPKRSAQAEQLLKRIRDY